jgi:hypothetical protein
VFHAGRRLENGAEVNIEELVAVIAVVPEGKLEYLVARNAGRNLRFEKVEFVGGRTAFVTTNRGECG